MRPIKYLFIIFPALMLISSCAQKQIIKRYFILDKNAGSQDSLYFTPPLPFTVQVSSIKIAPAFDQTRIALRSKSHELRYYYYNLWAERPAQAIRFFIFSRLKETNLFQRCIPEAGAVTPDYLLSGYVEHLERVNLPENYGAHLKMRLELLHVKSGKVIASRQIDRSLPLQESSPMNEFAKAVSKILLEETDAFYTEIYQKLNAHNYGK